MEGCRLYPGTPLGIIGTHSFLPSCSLEARVPHSESYQLPVFGDRYSCFHTLLTPGLMHALLLLLALPAGSLFRLRIFPIAAVNVTAQLAHLHRIASARHAPHPSSSRHSFMPLPSSTFALRPTPVLERLSSRPKSPACWPGRARTWSDEECDSRPGHLDTQGGAVWRDKAWPPLSKDVIRLMALRTRNESATQTGFQPLIFLHVVC